MSDTGNIRVAGCNPIFKGSYFCFYSYIRSWNTRNTHFHPYEFNTGTLFNFIYEMNNFTNGRGPKRWNADRFGQGFYYFRRYWNISHVVTKELKFPFINYTFSFAFTSCLLYTSPSP